MRPEWRYWNKDGSHTTPVKSSAAATESPKSTSRGPRAAFGVAIPTNAPAASTSQKNTIADR